MELQKLGILAKYGVEVLGSYARTIEMAEDSGLFEKAMDKLGSESARSAIAHNAEKAMKAKKIGLAPIVRPSFAFDGMDDAIARTG